MKIFKKTFLTLHQGLKWHLKQGEQERFEDSLFFLLIPLPLNSVFFQTKGKVLIVTVSLFSTKIDAKCLEIVHKAMAFCILRWSVSHQVMRKSFTWYERGFEVPYSNQAPHTVIQGSKAPFSVSILHILGLIASNKAKYQVTSKKMQVIRKISRNN